MNDINKKIIRAMCDNDLSASRAAKTLFYTRQNVYRHIDEIRFETGLDCRKFYDAIELLEMIKEE